MKREEVLAGKLDDWIKSEILEKESFGLLLEDYSYVDYPMEGGVHVFRYGKTPFLQEVPKEIFTKDDDGQPNATFSDYLDTVWHFVPFWC